MSGRWGYMCGGVGVLWLPPAWARVPLGSVGRGNQQQLLLRVAGSRRCGVLRSCESPQPWAVMLTHVSPRVGSSSSSHLLWASTGSICPPETRQGPGR